MTTVRFKFDVGGLNSCSCAPPILHGFEKVVAFRLPVGHTDNTSGVYWPIDFHHTFVGAAIPAKARTHRQTRQLYQHRVINGDTIWRASWHSCNFTLVTCYRGRISERPMSNEIPQKNKDTESLPLPKDWSASVRNAVLKVIGILTSLSLCAAIAVAYAAAPDRSTKGNSYHLYTKALTITDAGVVAVPPRFKWSIETSWSGIDAQGKDLPDTRVMMRLYDPDHNFTALTAQMDLETAEKLQRQLANIIAKKRTTQTIRYRPPHFNAE